MEQIQIKCTTTPGATLPQYKTSGAAGADICAHLDQDLTLKPLTRSLIPTGLFFEIPKGYEIQVRPRSGLAYKNGITVLNTPGTIDSDYRGELRVLLINLSNNDFTIHNGDRIAQIIVSPVPQASFIQADTLSTTARGSGGFGSTGQ